MTTTTNAVRPVGTKVGVDHPKCPGTWIVKSNGPVNATLEPENGGRGLRVSHTLLTDPPQPGGVPGSTVQTVSAVTYYEPGELIRITEGRYAGLYVVIADRRADKVNLALLGGDGGRYLRAARRGLVRVDPKDVLK